MMDKLFIYEKKPYTVQRMGYFINAQATTTVKFTEGLQGDYLEFTSVDGLVERVGSKEGEVKTDKPIKYIIERVSRSCVMIYKDNPNDTNKSSPIFRHDSEIMEYLCHHLGEEITRKIIKFIQK